MLDVFHYFLEEDYRYTSEYEPVYKDAFRENLLKSFYGIDYKYKNQDYNSEQREDLNRISDNLENYKMEWNTPESENDQEFEILTPFNPRKSDAQPYIAPTEMANDDQKPFGNILDSPLG